MQWIIAIADRISSGWDRDTFDKEYNRAVAWQDYRKTRLLPIFESLMCDFKKSDDYFYRYPLKETSPDNIFPGLKKVIHPKDNREAIGEYKRLFEEFVYALERLFHKEENFELWFEHLDSLMMIFTSAIPAARAGNVIPDVSLYDHSKITAALAVAIYLYHQHTDSMTIEEIKDYDIKKFLLISGDFYGIQSFIFSDSGEAGKNRAKILQRPYIPGSTIKGALRTAYLNLMESEKKLSEKGKECNARNLEQRLMEYNGIPTDLFRMVKVSDFMPVGETQTRIVYGINKKKKGKKTKGIIKQMDRVQKIKSILGES